MPKSAQQKLQFTKAMEINGISPIPHYFEEIYTNQIGLPRIGIRGDQNYLFYSIDGLGGGHYEDHEKALAADSVYDYFAIPGNKAKFFDGIEAIIAKLRAKSDEIDSLNLFSMGVQDLAKLFIEVNTLHGDIFSYFVVSQPYRMGRFETILRRELGKRVAGSRIDAYTTALASSAKPTKITYEEIAWLKLLITYKTKYGAAKLSKARLDQDYPDLYKAVSKHYYEYRTLTLGDGNWKFDPDYYLKHLLNDFKKDLAALKARYKEISQHEQVDNVERTKLIEELYLDDETVAIMDFLADIGHTRLSMRIEGWVPFVRTIIQVDIALSDALGFKTEDGLLLNFMLPSELESLAKTGKAVSVAEVIKRIGDHSEFLILNDNGAFRIYYGNEAGRKFKALVPPIDHAVTTELIGSTAVRGKITGTVTVYQWGDDLQAKQKTICQHPILVAGQTRPAMMPIIRLAKGIITDEGGVTSHAAIVSRELGIPSIIGTIYATRTFKDGDLVELDADHGIVRKLS